MTSGKKVICIDDQFPQWAIDAYTALPKLNQIYTVRDVRMGRLDPSDTKMETMQLAITVEELRNPIDIFTLVSHH
jgi:hypothetical protein